MEENHANINERETTIKHKMEMVFCGFKVDITTPFEFNPSNLVSTFSDIPDSVVSGSENNEREGHVLFLESEKSNLVWDEKTTTLSVFGKTDDYLTGQALVFKAAQVAEYLRQMEGQVTTHGSSVRFPNGKAVIIMGNSGAGKTSATISLCRKFGAELIGNDQVIFDVKNNLKVVGGTKDLIIRKAATKHNLPDLSYLFDSKENTWKAKRKIKPDELGITVCAEESDVCAIVWLHLDADKNEPTYMKKIIQSDIVDSLNISERFSRQISGVQSPLINDSGAVQSFGISLDNETTRKNRVDALEKFRQVGIYYLFGSNLDEVGDAIKHLSEYK